MNKTIIGFSVLMLCILCLCSATCASEPPGVETPGSIGEAENPQYPTQDVSEVDIPDRGIPDSPAPGKSSGQTDVFLKAVRSGDAEDAQKLLSRDNGLVNAKDSKTGETALIIASRNKDNAMLKLLISGGANANGNDNDGYTALIYCIKGGFDQGVDLLLQSEGIALDYRTLGQRETALHIGVETDNTAMVKMLLGKRANANLKNAAGKTAFMIAVEKKDVTMIRLFKDVPSADITQTNDEGVPPLLLAIEKRYPVRVIEALLQFRNAIDSRDDRGRDAFAYQEQYARNDTRLRELLENARSSSL